MGQNIADLALDHPRVQEAKRQYEAAHPLRSKTAGGAFGNLLVLHRNALPLTDIARVTGLSTQYLKRSFAHFLPFCAHPPGYARRHAFSERRKTFRKMKVEQVLPEYPQTRAVMKRAQTHGCIVKSMARYDDHRAEYLPYLHHISVNWQPCLVAWCQVISRAKGKEYARFYLTHASLEQVDAAILYIAISGYPERFFVIPTATLFQKIFAAGSKRSFINVPLRVSKKSGGARARINLGLYEDAWHLLELLPKELPPT